MEQTLCSPFQTIRTYENSLDIEFLYILLLLSKLLGVLLLHDLIITDAIWSSHGFKFQAFILPCHITLIKFCDDDSIFHL